MANGMTQTESHILVALSGGADSVCLLCVLKELQQELGISVSAMHVHHGIRGAEADRDAQFCKELCAQLDVPCQVVYVDVPAVAAEKKMSLEEAARMVRYRELENRRQQILKENEISCCRRASRCDEEERGVWIAVAHHREDQAETVLWNLFRGSGLKGMGGMEPVNGAVIRPLLDVAKEEILNYLRQQETRWQQDSTNDSNEYTRNQIRHHILGYATEHINKGSTEHICQAAKVAGQADAYLRKQARRWLENNDSVNVSQLVREDEILQSYILREMLVQSCGLIDVTVRHVEAMNSLLAEMPGGGADRQIDLGEGWIVRRSYDRLWIEQRKRQSDVTGEIVWDPVEVDIEKMLPSQKVAQVGDLTGSQSPLEIRFGDRLFSLKLISYEKTQKIPTNQYTKWINYDTLERTLVFRTRRAGDYILLPGGGRKTVKSYMIDEKIPAGERDRIPVVAQGSHVLWIAGYRLSEGAKIGEDTRMALEIQMHGG